MSEQDPYRVFVAHLFAENEEYRRVFEYLESRDNFFYINCSDFENVPGSGDDEALKEALRTQIKEAEVVIFPLALSDGNPMLAGFQLDAAEAFKKPILGIQSFGGTVVVDQAIMSRCTDIVEWNDRVIISAIKRLARGEDTAQWETIEFKLD
ncbi:MAG: hypothetical protein OEU86_08200 [Gammaproteobacteria bacterium]|nr:hypothetical protein [Gammaproteobacteria bacterium]